MVFFVLFSALLPLNARGSSYYITLVVDETTTNVRFLDGDGNEIRELMFGSLGSYIYSTITFDWAC